MTISRFVCFGLGWWHGALRVAAATAVCASGALAVPAFQIVSEDDSAGVRSLAVRIENRVAESDLRQWAKTLRATRAEGKAPAKIAFYLPSMKLGQAPWAEIRFDAETKVSINGLRFDEVQSFGAEVASDHRAVIGHWLTSPPALPGKLTILRFPATGDQALDSLDTFTSNVARDPELSQEITTRRDQVVRGNTIVTPIGQGLLYVQPLYLDAPGDSLPTLWQVIVSFGDGKVYSGTSFQEALSEALGFEPDPVSGPAPAPGSTPAPGPTIAELVRRASDEFEAYRKAFGEGKDEEAARRLQAFRQALAQARRVADQGGAGAP